MEVDLFRLLSVDQLQKAVDDHEHELLTNFGRFLAAFFSNLPILCPIKNDIEFPSLWKLVLWKESDYDQALYKKLIPEYVSSNIPPTYSASLPVQLFLITNNLTEACLYVDHFNDIRSQILLRVLSDLQYGLRLTEQHVTQVFVSDFIGRLSYGMVNGRGYGSGYGGEYGRGYGKEYGNGYDRPSNQVHDEQNGTNGTKNVFNDYNDSTSSVTYNNINITVHTVMSDDQIKTHVDVYTRLSIMLNISWTYDLLQYLQSALQYVIDGLPETVDDQVQLPRPPVYVLPAQDDENIPELVQTNIMYQLIRVYLTVLQRCNWLKSVAGTLMSNIWKYNLNFSTQVLHTEVDDVDTAVYHSFEDVLRMILIHNYRDQMALLSRRGAKKDDVDKIRQRMSRMGYSRPQDGTEGFENFGTNGGTIGAKMDYKNDDNSVQYDSQSGLLYSHHGHQSNFSDSLQYDNGYSNEKGPLQYKNDYSNDKKKLQYQNSYINDKSSIQYKDDYSNSKSSLQYRKNYSSTNHSKTDYIPQLEADEIDQLIKILQFFDDISTDKERYLPPLSESTVEQWRTAMYSEVNVVSARPTTELNLGDDKLKMIVPQEVYLILDYVANSLPYVSLSDRSLIGISLKLKPSEMVKVENSTFYSTIQRGNRSKMSFGTKGGELASTMNTNQIDTHSNGINHVKYEKNNASDPNIALLSTKEPYGTLQNRIQASLVRLGGRSISHANTTVKSLNYMSDVYHSNVPSTSANIPQFEPQASSYDKDMSNSKHNMGNNENLELVNQDQSNIKHDGSYDGQEKLKHNEDKGNINHEKDHGKSPSHNNQATSFQIQPIPTNQAKSGLEKELLQEKEYIEKIRKSTMLINAQKASLYYDVNEEKRVEILNKIRQLKMTKSPGMRRKVGPNGDGNDVNSAIKLDYSVTQPSNSTMKPGYSTEHLSYSTMQFVQPGDSTVQPGFSTTHPSYSTMQPIHSTMKPNFSTKKPIYGTMQHIHSTTQPNYSTVTPDQDTKHNISRSHHEEPLDLSDELKAISARLSSLKQKWNQSPEDIVKQSLNQNLNFDVNFNVRSQFNDNLKMKSQFDENSKLRPRSGHTSTNKSFTSQRPATYKNIQIHNVNSKLYVKDHEDNEDLSSGISSSSISPRLSDRKKVRKTRRVLETERERMLERQRMEQEAEANSKSNNDGLSNDSDSNTDSGLKSSGEIKNGAQKGTEKKDRLQDATKHDGGRYGKGQTQYSYDNDKNIEKVERKNYSDENNSEIDNDGLIYPNPQHVLYKTGKNDDDRTNQHYDNNQCYEQNYDSTNNLSTKILTESKDTEDRTNEYYGINQFDVTNQYYKQNYDITKKLSTKINSKSKDTEDRTNEYYDTNQYNNQNYVSTKNYLQSETKVTKDRTKQHHDTNQHHGSTENHLQSKTKATENRSNHYHSQNDVHTTQNHIQHQKTPYIHHDLQNSEVSNSQHQHQYPPSTDLNYQNEYYDSSTTVPKMNLNLNSVDYVPEAIPSPTTPASIGRLDLSLLSDRQEEKKKKSTGWTEIKVLDRTPKHFVKKKEVVLPDWVKLLPYEAKPTSSRLLSLGGAADSKAKSSRTGRKSKSPYLNIKDVIHDSGYLDFETGRRQKAVEPKLEDTVENQSESEQYDQNNVFDMTEEQINRLINS